MRPSSYARRISGRSSAADRCNALARRQSHNSDGVRSSFPLNNSRRYNTATARRSRPERTRRSRLSRALSLTRSSTARFSTRERMPFVLSAFARGHIGIRRRGSLRIPCRDSLPISSIRPSIRPSDVRMPRISFSRFMVSSFGKRATKRHEETQESMPLCGLLELGGHMRDRIAPIAKAGGAGSAHTEQVGRSGNEVADGDRAGIGEQAGALPIAWSVVGAECCERDLKDPRIGKTHTYLPVG